MKLSNFNYELPKDLLAEYPSDQRDESKLMVLDRINQKIEHKTFKDLIDYFNDGDVFVLNNTKVFPARLMGNKEKTGASIEVFLLRELNRDQRAHPPPAARWAPAPTPVIATRPYNCTMTSRCRSRCWIASSASARS